jgi:ferredoxin-like protein FixX
MNLTDLAVELETFGLHLRGVLNLATEEVKSLKIDSHGDHSIALAGNIGSSYWPVFSVSPEYQDGHPDPLDRWSRRVAEQVAEVSGTRAIYPFEGPPYYPFLQWAERAEALSQSPLGLMIHPQYGLWHSYRFGLLIPHSHAPDQKNISVESPCLSCEARPCLHACPANAFSAKGYDVDSCAAHLKATPDASCHQQGCMARLACPVGEAYRYEAVQHSFHLRAFMTAR